MNNEKKEIEKLFRSVFVDMGVEVVVVGITGVEDQIWALMHSRLVYSH